MSRRSWALALAVAVVVGAAVPQLAQDLSDANSTVKMHFTRTLDSTPDPGAGHVGHLAMVLLPEKGAIYDGSMTFTSSEPVWVQVLHEIGPDDARGQPTWTVDGKNTYGLTRTYGGPSGQVEFTGAAVALHSSSTFTATTSVDAWIRDGTVRIEGYTFDVDLSPPPLQLYDERVQVTVPTRGALYDGEAATYIITDSSDEDLATEISDVLDWPVRYAPPLAEADGATLYMFTNGVNGDGMYGFQKEVLSVSPAASNVTSDVTIVAGFQEDVLSVSPVTDEYTQLAEVVKVSWKLGQHSSILESEEDILEAERTGRLEVDRTGAILNAPQITWPDGGMKVLEEPDAGGAQVVEIGENSVTFLAHRGWGHDGRASYHIVTGAWPDGPAELMGVPTMPVLAELESGVASSMYQFRNGLVGPGTLGFQPDVDASEPDQYSPLRGISIVEWYDEDNAKLLQTARDVDSVKEDELVSVRLARAQGENHVINAPAVDPFR